LLGFYKISTSITFYRENKNTQFKPEVNKRNENHACIQISIVFAYMLPSTSRRMRTLIPERKLPNTELQNEKQ